MIDRAPAAERCPKVSPKRPDAAPRGVRGPFEPLETCRVRRNDGLLARGRRLSGASRLTLLRIDDVFDVTAAQLPGAN